MSLISSLSPARDMAVDLGTANTLVYVRGRGIVISEPSVVAVDVGSGEVHAVGEQAKQMLGRTPSTINAMRPLKDGVIADFEVTGVEKRAVEEACLGAGAREAYLIEEPMAAAIGSGLPVSEPTGSLIIDIGGGTTEVAVISLGDIVVSESVRVGGDEMDEAIINWCKREKQLLIGQRTAEEVKQEAGSATPLGHELEVEIRGRDLGSGLPKAVMLDSEGVRKALDDPISQIVAAVRDTLDRTPPELAGDVMERGMILAGGGALLQGMSERMSEECKMPARLADSPMTCVATGSGQALEEFEAIKRSLKNSRVRRRY
jgi:rod shape-determining protein MreB